MASFFSDERRLEAARRIFAHVGEHLGAPVSVRLWDGSLVPLGPEAGTELQVSIASHTIGGRRLAILIAREGVKDLANASAPARRGV